MKVLSWFRRSAGAPAREASALRLTLYTRPGCGLCEEMKDVLRGAGREGQYVLEEVDISLDAELERRHGLSIPVLSIEGRPAFKGRMTADEFRARFDRRRGELGRERA